MSTELPKKYTDFIDESLKYIPSYNGLDILEIGVGSTSNCLSTVIYELYKPKSIIGVDPKFSFAQIAPNFKIVNEDIRDTSFEDNQFDCIVSIAVFEHVRVFDLALKEMHRILKPGGKIFSIFGPIYSSPIGHHLWYQINQKLYKYPTLNIPAYSHLLLDEKEFANMLVEQKIADQDHARILSDYVYHTSDQNRYLFNDYEKLFHDSDFKVSYFKGTGSFPRLNHLLNEDYSMIQEKLHQKFPTLPVDTFDWNSIIVCLEK